MQPFHPAYLKWTFQSCESGQAHCFREECWAKITNRVTNSVDPDELSHLDLQCLQRLWTVRLRGLKLRHIDISVLNIYLLYTEKDINSCLAE